MNNFESKKHLIHNQESVIRHFELGIIHIDKSHDCFLKLAKQWNDQKNIFWENNELYERLLHKNIFHLLKLKKIQDFIKFYVYDKEKIRDYFDVEFYRKTYNDLNNFSDEELFHHYLGYGVDEGRNCIVDQYKVFPEIYSNKLQNCKLENLFNIPSTFDIYLYKTEQNKSMSSSSNIDILNHYDNHGRENEDIILKNGFNNAELFKEIYIHYIKLFFNIKVKLDNKFTYNQLIHYNKDLIEKGLLKNIILYSYKNELIPNKIKIEINESNKDINFNKINNKINNLNNKNNLIMNNMEINWIKKLIPTYKNSSDEEIKIFIEENQNKIKNIDIKYLNYYKETNNIFYYNSEYVKYHYKYVGSLKENDPFLTFNSSVYKILNKRIPNLLNMSNSAAKEHYFTIGYKQNLSYEIPKDFHPFIYKYLHIDEFKNMNKQELIEHYLHFGHYEKRNYKFEYFFNLDAFKIIYKKNESNEEKLIYDYYYNYYKKKENQDAFIHYLKINPDLVNNLIPTDYDEYIYRLTNNDLKKFNSIELKIHLLEYGLIEGRTYKFPSDFDVNLYRKFNDDLANLNNDELILHYIDFGKAEKRIAYFPKEFRLKNYKFLNPELNNLNEDELLKHFLTIGIQEKKPYYIPIDFKPEIYKKLYKDLQELNNEQLIHHYVNRGIVEKRIYKLDKKFNPTNYRLFYKDLTNLNDEEALYHYVNIGKNEGRIYEVPEDFTIENYKNLHFDLTFMNDNEVYDHFIQHGISENRQYKGYNKFYKKPSSNELNTLSNKQQEQYEQNNNNEQLPKDFSLHGYRLFNPDLFYYDNDEFLIKHYLEKGIKEKRLYKIPDNFDVNLYKKLNPDTENMNHNQIIEHFKTIGVHENRKYEFPKNFDYNFYKKVYLNNDNKYNKEKIKEHYLNEGIKNKYWIKLPDDFDINIYKKLNQDLNELDEIEILKEYIQYGHKNRVYK
jgi:hypothetical protein